MFCELDGMTGAIENAGAALLVLVGTTDLYSRLAVLLGLNSLEWSPSLAWWLDVSGFACLCPM